MRILTVLFLIIVSPAIAFAAPASTSVDPPKAEVLNQAAQEGDKAAFDQLRTMAEKGDPEAEFFIGDFYYKGYSSFHKTDLHLEPDNAAALKWWRKAAEQGNGKAQEQLGLMYSRGIGIPTDYAEAYFWISLARRARVDTAPWLLDGPPGAKPRPPDWNPEDHLNVDQINAVERRVKDWIRAREGEKVYGGDRNSREQKAMCEWDTKNECYFDLCQTGIDNVPPMNDCKSGWKAREGKPAPVGVINKL